GGEDAVLDAGLLERLGQGDHGAASAGRRAEAPLLRVTADRVAVDIGLASASRGLEGSARSDCLVGHVGSCPVVCFLTAFITLPSEHLSTPVDTNVERNPCVTRL